MNNDKLTVIRPIHDSSFSSILNRIFLSPKCQKAFEMILFILFCLNFLAITYINLFDNQYHQGFDASAFFLKAIEIYRQGTLFISNWSDQTTLMLDSSIPLAALLYGITGNIFVSYGMANTLINAAFFGILIALMQELNINRLSSLIILNLVISPYVNFFYNNANPVDYFPTLFVSASFYNVKMLTCLLVFYSVVLLEKGVTGWKTNTAIIVSAFLMVITGLSSGLYVSVTILLPSLLYIIVKTCMCNDFGKLFNKTFLLVILFLALAFVGKIASSKILGFESKENDMVLTGADNFWANIGSMFVGLINLMGAIWIKSDIPIFSEAGISLIINLALFLILAVGVVISFFMLKKQKISVLTDTITGNAALMGLCVVVVNVAMFVISYTTYGSPIFEVRYLIPIFFVLCFAAGICLPKIKYTILRNIINVVAILALLLSGLLSYKYYFATRIDDSIFEIPKILESIDSPVVYGVGDDITIDVRNLRAIDTSKVYKVVTGNGFSVYHWGDYTYYDDSGEYEGEIIVLATDSSFEALPEYMKDRFTYIESCGRIGIYTCESNCFDFESGLPNDGNTKSIDYAYSNGMQTQVGTINSNGSIESNGSSGYLVYGPYVPVDGQTYNFTLHYNILSSPDNNIGYFDVACNNGQVILASEKISPDSNTLTLSNVSLNGDLGNLEYRVFVNENAFVQVDYIEITHS